MIELLQVLNNVLLNRVVQGDMNDDPALVIIGASEEETTTTPVLMDQAIIGVANKTYTVPADKKLIPLKLWVNKMSFTTDKKVIVEVTSTATAKIRTELIVGQTEKVEQYPFADFEFAAADVVKLYLTSEAGADALIVGAKFVGLLIDA
jgi:hypothetical protein